MSVDHDLLLVLGSAGLGEGEPDLGAKLMASFLDQLLAGDRLPARVICINTGVFLTTAGSPVLEPLRQLAAAGCEILSCGTCLAYYGRTDRLELGSKTTMRETVQALLSFPRVLRL